MTAKPRSHYWRYIYTAYGEVLHNVGIREDGSLSNPNGYDEIKLRAAIDGILARRAERRSAAAKQAAETRRQRVEKLIYAEVQRLQDGGVFIPADLCRICGRGLDDPASLGRGIGSDCWQRILRHLTDRLEAEEQPPPLPATDELADDAALSETYDRPACHPGRRQRHPPRRATTGRDLPRRVAGDRRPPPQRDARQ